MRWLIYFKFSWMPCAFLMLIGLFSQYKSFNKLPWFTKVLKYVVNLKHESIHSVDTSSPLKLNICFLNCSLKVSLFTNKDFRISLFPILQGVGCKVSALLIITRVIVDAQYFFKVASTLEEQIHPLSVSKIKAWFTCVCLLSQFEAI